MQKTVNPVAIIARIEIKKNGIVVYQVRSSNGVNVYNVTVTRGSVNSCSCPSRKPCKHMNAVQAREQERIAQEQERDTSREAEKQAYWEYEFQCGYYNHPWA